MELDKKDRFILENPEIILKIHKERVESILKYFSLFMMSFGIILIKKYYDKKIHECDKFLLIFPVFLGILINFDFRIMNKCLIRLFLALIILVPIGVILIYLIYSQTFLHMSNITKVTFYIIFPILEVVLYQVYTNLYKRIELDEDIENGNYKEIYESVYTKYKN